MNKIRRPERADEGPQPGPPPTLDEMLRTFVNIKEKVESLETDRKGIQAELVGQYRGESIKKHTIGYSPTENITGTLVEQHRLTFDEDRLKKTLGAEVFNKYTKRVLDKDKIEAAISLGELDANLVASCTEEKVTEFIKVSKTKRRV